MRKLTGVSRFEALFLLALATCGCKAFAVDCGCHVATRVVDGTNVPASTFPTVGLIGDVKNGYYCSGVLIAPHFVLGAAHCTVDTSGKAGQDGLRFYADTDGRFKLNGIVYNTKRVTPNPTFTGKASFAAEGAFDLAIFELDSDVPGVTPTLVGRTAPVTGTVVTLVGYGPTGTGTTGQNGNYPAEGTVNTGLTPIDAVTATFVKWTFDNRPAPDKESSVADGDSGGPQLVRVNGLNQIVSITSTVSDGKSQFGSVASCTRVDAAITWIESITGPLPQPAVNHPPTIQSLGALPSAPKAGVVVTFTAAASDVDSDPLSYRWNFGDGSAELNNGAASVQHTFAAAGSYTVQVVVGDGRDGSATQTLQIQVASSTPATPGNNPPVISSLTYTPTTPAFGEAISFSATATDPDNNSLTYLWQFGDGMEFTTSVGTVLHTYASAGTYTLKLIVSDGKGGSTSAQTTAESGLFSAVLLGKIFALNFVKPSADLLDFTLKIDALAFKSKVGLAGLNGAVVKAFIGTTQIDTLTVNAGKGAGQGVFSLNPKTGAARYRISKFAQLESLLTPYGAENNTVSKTITVPLRLEINGSRYGVDASFFYNAHASKSGTGK